jgi:hypothetical protein
MDKVKAFFSSLSAPLEWTADQVRARPKGFLIVAGVAIGAAFVLGARWF